MLNRGANTLVYHGGPKLQYSHDSPRARFTAKLPEPWNEPTRQTCIFMKSSVASESAWLLALEMMSVSVVPRRFANPAKVDYRIESPAERLSELYFNQFYLLQGLDTTLSPS